MPTCTISIQHGTWSSSQKEGKGGEKIFVGGRFKGTYIQGLLWVAARQVDLCTHLPVS